MPPFPTRPLPFPLPAAFMWPRQREAEGKKSTSSDPGPSRKKQNVDHFIFFTMKRAVLNSRESLCNLTTASFMDEVQDEGVSAAS